MKNMLLLFCCIIMVCLPAFAQDAAFDNDSLVDGAIAPALVSKQFSFTEGPAVDKDGNIFFTDQPNDRIWKYGTDGKLSLFMEKTGRSNGLYFDAANNIISCADERDQLWRISLSGKVDTLLSFYQGKLLNGPNDLWLDIRGGIYFTDPFYPRPYWQRTEPDITGQHVYYLPAGSQEAIVVDSSLVKPNGIVGTPDGKYLYVADIGDNKTYRFSVNADGSLGNRMLFTEQGSDGITLDEKGNVYLTGRGVTVYNPAGQKVAHIPVSEGWTANLCFGGKNRNILFITASKAVYTLPMRVRGVE